MTMTTCNKSDCRAADATHYRRLNLPKVEMLLRSARLCQIDLLHVHYCQMSCCCQPLVVVPHYNRTNKHGNCSMFRIIDRDIIGFVMNWHKRLATTRRLEIIQETTVRLCFADVIATAVLAIRQHTTFDCQARESVGRLQPGNESAQI